MRKGLKMTKQCNDADTTSLGKDDRVSIIIPCYNHGHHLPRVLDSLRRQEHRNIEAIIVDDGSPTPVQLPDVTYDFPVKLIRIPNSGLPGARNEGLRYATGSWVKFLDADDGLHPDCISLQLASMGGRKDLVSTIGFEEVDELSGVRKSIVPGYGDLGEALFQINIGPPHIYMFSTDTVKKLGGFHEGERVRGGHEDYDLVMRVCAAGYHAVTVHKVGAIYYRRQGTMSSDAEAMDRTRVAVWAHNVMDIVHSRGCSHTIVLAALAGWIRHADITPQHLAAPLDDVAGELAELVREALPCLPKTETNMLRNRVMYHSSTGARLLYEALAHCSANDGISFNSPQEMIDRRLGFISPLHRKGNTLSSRVVNAVRSELWRKDARLAGIDPLLDGVKVLSLDVFDTLLFRACMSPEDIYESVGIEAAGRLALHPSCSPLDYKMIRASALDTAYREMDVEPTLEQIISHLPPVADDPKSLLNWELKAEVEHCYLNPSMVSFLKECRKRGIAIVLLSDMYLGAERIRTLLERCSLPMAWIDNVLVSVDEGAMKSSGELFQRMFERYPYLDRGQFLHIGDNFPKEIVPAGKLGMRTWHYDVIHSDETCVMDYENFGEKPLLPALTSLRRLAMAMHGDIDPSMVRWHKLGSGVIGPFVAAFCSWIVNVAQREKVDAIAPLMREAVLLTPMLKAEVERRGLEIPILPLYVSRQSVVIAGKNDFNTELFDSMARTRQYFKISELFSTLEFKGVPEQFAEHAETYLENARAVILDSGQTLYDSLEAYLLEGSNRQRINEAFKGKRDALTGYINGVLGENRMVATVDLGFLGQIQEGIETACKIAGENRDWLHLMGFGRERTATLVAKGIHLRLFGGGMGCSKQLVGMVHRSAPVLEQLFMLEEGSTLGYAPGDGGGWEPVIEENPIPAEEVEIKRVVQDGVRRFQELWFMFDCMCPQIVTAMLNQREHWARLIHRLIRMPTPEEARLIGGMHNDTNYGSTRTVRMCPEDEVEAAKAMEPTESFQKMRYTPAVWPIGIMTLAHPDYIVGAEMANIKGAIFQTFLTLAQTIHKGGGRVITVGTDGWAADFILAARMNDLDIVCVVNDDHAPFGGRFKGLDIVTLDQAMGKGVDCFVIPSRESTRRYRQAIADRCMREGGSPAVYHYEFG